MNIPLNHLIIIALIFFVLLIIIYFILKRQQRMALELLNKEIDNLKAAEQKAIAENSALMASNRDLELSNHGLQTEVKNLNQQLDTLKALEKDLNNKLLNTEDLYQELKLEYATKTIENNNLKEKLAAERLEIERLNEKFKQAFENLAQKILEEKAAKFTLQNKENLDAILKPFQEKINELKQTVNDTYDKESKQRFSLGEKVKELAELNEQISLEAKKLTKALQSESKTQGNWGELILENILEKSGLVKGREYFMEYQLTDQNNKALYSQYSGKKMRPDAVVKYPDDRSVIIDSKVSLTAFLETVDQPDADIVEMKLNQHLKSIKNHINQLSAKAYDDYDKSLDFVMMFIPSEAAYIAAMQKDPNLWSYAYDKRILLLNPSNLITSLKLLAELWKRDYQNKNALAIANRGAKLYNKFVGFVQSLDLVGKHLDQAEEAYNKAYKQLYTGRDNLVLQTEKLKAMGVKTKKKIAPGLLESAQENTLEEE